MEKAIKKYTVYVHTNKINGKKYVGITSMKPELRWANGYGYRGQSRFMKAIRKYGWHNFAHEILYTNLEKSNAEAIEKELIKEYKSANSKHGYNSDNGGISKIEFSEEHRDNIRKSRAHIQMSEKTKEKISNATKGKNNYWYGKKRPIEQYKHTPVICIETGDVYISIAEATRKNNVATGSISKCCNGKMKTAGGYHWGFVEEDN